MGIFRARLCSCNSSQIAAKIATNEVDHGSEIAMKTTAMSAAFVHAAVLRQSEGEVNARDGGVGLPVDVRQFGSQGLPLMTGLPRGEEAVEGEQNSGVDAEARRQPQKPWQEDVRTVSHDGHRSIHAW